MTYNVRKTNGQAVPWGSNYGMDGAEWHSWHIRAAICWRANTGEPRMATHRDQHGKVALYVDNKMRDNS